MEAEATVEEGGGNSESTVVSWSTIITTLVVSILQSVAFYSFFLYRRSKDSADEKHTLYEPRYFTRKDRSPKPFGDSWYWEAWNVSQDTLRKYVGADTYMYLRFLRLGARIASIGTLFSLVLLPVYGGGGKRGSSTEQFNRLTLARVVPNSGRLWLTAICWWCFIAFIIRELLEEYKLYLEVKKDFLALGDPDSIEDSRYALRLEQLPDSLKSDQALTKYLENLFPMSIRQANVYLDIEELEKLIEERQEAVVQVEKAVALTKTKPDEPSPQSKINSKLPCLGEKVDTIDHYCKEIKRLNDEIDTMRKGILSSKDAAEKWALGEGNDDEGDLRKGPQQQDCDEASNTYLASGTGIVVMTSLQAKQVAFNSDDYLEGIKVFVAPDPGSILWENVTTPIKRQRLMSIVIAILWMAGILFWAVPVSLVTALANLESILESLDIEGAIDPNSVLYGLIAGLLPVVALNVLMILLYMGIVAAGTKGIKFKSSSEVDAYTLYWHLLFQFANLWLILIGGSLFNQLGGLLEDPTKIVGVIADSLPGASVFFANMMIVGGLGSFGLELSMLPQYGTALVMSILTPEAQRTQRMIDEAKVPPEVKWGEKIPPHVFIFLVMIMYMPIVPLMEVFALVYFGGSYLIWKHQCLHVYAQPCEGGGVTTWQSLFGFLMACLYTSEAVFIAYMGIKKAPGPAGCGFVPLTGTIIFHIWIHKQLILPNRSLSLEVVDSSNKDIGELFKIESTDIEDKVYGQSALKTQSEERGPMPYRRDSEPVFSTDVWVSNCETQA
jgi:hypothetical protein